MYINKISAAAFPLCPRTGTASPKGGMGIKGGGIYLRWKIKVHAQM